MAGGVKNSIYNSSKYSSSSIGKSVLKRPQKKFIDKKRTSASIRQPREVEGRRDIEILFEDMTMNDLAQVVEKGDINAVIKHQRKKIEASTKSRNAKNKRQKVTENEDFQPPVKQHQADPFIEQKAIAQALQFQKELNE